MSLMQKKIHVAIWAQVLLVFLGVGWGLLGGLLPVRAWCVALGLVAVPSSLLYFPIGFADIHLPALTWFLRASVCYRTGAVSWSPFYRGSMPGAYWSCRFCLNKGNPRSSGARFRCGKAFITDPYQLLMQEQATAMFAPMSGNWDGYGGKGKGKGAKGMQSGKGQMATPFPPMAVGPPVTRAWRGPGSKRALKRMKDAQIAHSLYGSGMEVSES